ncbi:hypothetical protein [Devosia lacusdianchii]|uniref:hypothetical protein n=1 Tax=Devosia lacusdianchii TaxID=2917991 RepID=UPI001F05CB45|nr:hypothetical protein [Devosia sp. JXJ CY 41]
MTLLLTTDSEAEFVIEMTELWLHTHQGDHFPATEAKRANLADIRRKLAGKYTKDERQEIGQTALDLMD